MQNNKVKLTKQQAAAMDEIIARVENLRVTGGVWDSKASVVQYKIETDRFGGIRKAASSISLDDFITALYVGYEADLTVEEELELLFEDAMTKHEAAKRVGTRSTIEYYRGKAEAYRKAIDLIRKGGDQ